MFGWLMRQHPPEQTQWFKELAAAEGWSAAEATRLWDALVGELWSPDQAENELPGEAPTLADAEPIARAIGKDQHATLRDLRDEWRDSLPVVF